VAVAEDLAAINNRFTEINPIIKKPLLFGRGFFMIGSVGFFNIYTTKEFVAMLLKHPEALGTSLINLEGYFCNPSWR
jgi:hypothetical protein